MMYNEQEKKGTTASRHTIRIDNREQIHVTGVEDVDSFDENTVVLMTEKGAVAIVGEDLHINKLSLEEGQLVIAGNISGLRYEDEHIAKNSESIWQKIFR